MDLCDLAPSYVRAIAPYQPGKPISELAREMGLNEADIVKLASNENPLGCSPKVTAAIQAALPELARYPDGNGFELKAALSRFLDVERERIVLGNGSNDVLDMVARAFLSPGTSAVYAQYAFAVYPLATQTVGARGIEVPAVEYGHDLKGMLEAITEDTRVVFVANPNNPTGTLASPADLLNFIEQVPRQVVVVLDEAYGEYLAPELVADSIGWVRRFPNLVVTRTFSKAYGLAGLRVGYAVAHPEVADVLNRVRHPFNVNSLALVAAEAALADREFVEQSRVVNANGMEQIYAGLRRLGLAYIPSYGNFVCFRVGPGMTVFQRLLKSGVIVRPVGGYAMPEYLRVSIGLESENATFLKALEKAVEESR